jgi:hypothetical protein
MLNLEAAGARVAGPSAAVERVEVRLVPRQRGQEIQVRSGKSKFQPWLVRGNGRVFWE